MSDLIEAKEARVQSAEKSIEIASSNILNLDGFIECVNDKIKQCINKGEFQLIYESKFLNMKNI